MTKTRKQQVNLQMHIICCFLGFSKLFSRRYQTYMTSIGSQLSLRWRLLLIVSLEWDLPSCKSWVSFVIWLIWLTESFLRLSCHILACAWILARKCILSRLLVLAPINTYNFLIIIFSENGYAKGSIEGISTSSGTEKLWLISQALGDVSFSYPFSTIMMEIQVSIYLLFLDLSEYEVRLVTFYCYITFGNSWRILWRRLRQKTKPWKRPQPYQSLSHHSFTSVVDVPDTLHLAIIHQETF